MAQGPYPFRDDEGAEWMAIFYHESAERFAHDEQPGRTMVAFLQGVDEGEPLYEIPAPAALPEPPSESWLRSLLEGARALKKMSDAITA